ncbi:MAG: glycosyltransferase family 1 protein [Litorilinea sp.]
MHPTDTVTPAAGAAAAGAPAADSRLHVAVNGWFLGQTTTGSGQYLHHLLRHLPRRFPQARLTVYTPRRADHAQRTAAWSVEFPDVEIVGLALPPGPPQLAKLWWEQITVPRSARKARGQGHAHVLWVPYWAAPLVQPCPTVVTVHDLIPLLLPAYRGGRLQRLYTALVSHSARCAAAILTVSHAAAADIATHLRVPRARVHVVHHGPNHAPDAVPDTVTCAVPADLAAHVRTRYALPADYFLYLGGFDVRKNVASIVAAYARYLARGGDPAIKLVIGGALPTIDSDFAPDPRRLARAQNLPAAQVHYIGFVEDAHKPTVYALARAYLFPSLYEGFGMMLLEAMAAGTPVITSGPPPTPAPFSQETP